MLVVTKSCDGLAKSILPPKERRTISISDINKISAQMQLDPAVSGSEVDAFIVSNQDLRRPNDILTFKEGLKYKHASAKVIFIAKDGKQNEFTSSYPGITKALMKPKTDDLREAVFSMAAELSTKPVVESAHDKAAVLNPKEDRIDPKDVLRIHTPVVQDDDDDDDDIEFDNPVELPMPDLQLDEEKLFEPQKEEPALVRRIKNAGSVADARDIIKEISASKIVTDLSKENAQYAQIENTLRGLSEQIYSIICNTSMAHSEKMSKIRTLVYSKHYHEAQCDTAIEQYVKQIIDAISTYCIDSVEDVLADTKKKMKNIVQYNDGTMNFGRMTAINEERGTTLLELAALEKELAEISTRVADAVTELVDDRLTAHTDNTGNSNLNLMLKSQGSYIVSAESIETMNNIIQLVAHGNEEFYEISRKVVDMRNHISTLLNLDKETITAQNEIIQYLTANNLEDTVIANTMLKKSLRVFTGVEGVGRSIVPYLLSKYKSRENKNVLTVDLTGTSKLENYGIKYYSLEDYRSNRYQEDFCVVVGELTSVEMAQSMVAILTKAADFYSVINVVLDPTNETAFDILASDVRVINFITDTKVPNMNETKQMLERFKYDNVARRLICNNISVPISSVAKYFNLLEDNSIQMLSIDHVNQIEECLFDGRNPYLIDAVIEAFKEVRKYA